MSNVHLIKGLYEAFGHGDVPAVLALFDASIAWREAEGNPYMPSGETWVGPEAVLENLFMKLGDEWDGFTVHPRAFHDGGLEAARRASTAPERLAWRSHAEGRRVAWQRATRMSKYELRQVCNGRSGVYVAAHD